MARENYYLLLELDPAKQDTNSIATAIEKKQAEWSRDRNHPTKKNAYQKNLENIEDIRSVMFNPIFRLKESMDAKKQLENQKKENLVYLDQMIEISAAPGFLDESQVNNLINKFSGKLTEKEIRNRIKVPINKTNSDSPKQKPVLDKSRFNSINECLKLLNKNDLYDFLELSISSSSNALLDQAEKLNSEFSNFNDKNAEITTKMELLGYCLVLFKTHSQREQYENSRSKQNLQNLEPMIEMAVQNGTIPSASMDKLLVHAGKTGVLVKEAKKYIINYATKRNWSIEILQSSNENNLVQCGNCNVVNNSNTKICVHCGENLFVECPKCKKTNPSINRACSNCGFLVGNISWVRTLLQKADHAFADGDFLQARSHLKKAATYWPDSNEIQAKITKTDYELQLKQDAYNQVEKALIEGRCVEGINLLYSLKKDDPLNSEIQRLESRLFSAVDSAKKHLAMGKSFLQIGKYNEAFKSFGNALLDSKDLIEAQEEILKCPLDAPKNISVMNSPNSIALKWAPSHSPGNVYYLVVRKNGSEPQNIHDGKLLSETTETFYKDNDTLPGEIYYYTICSKRGATLSVQSITTGPAFCIADISKLKITNNDKNVILEWEIPNRAIEVEIWRKINIAPKTRGDGVALPSGLKSFHDQKLTNGTKYGYLVVAVYRGPDNKFIYSEGISIFGVPNELPKPVTDLLVTRRGNTFEATWATPSNDQVQIYYTPSIPKYRCGDLVPESELHLLGKRIPNQTVNSIRGKVEINTLLYLLPLSITGSIVIIGKFVTLNWLDNVDEINVALKDNNMFVTWQWPPKVENVIIAFRKDQFPTDPEDQISQRVSCTRFKYDQTGGYRLKTPSTNQIYISVFAVSKMGNKEHYASGETSGARKFVPLALCRLIKYRITQKPTWFGKNNDFILTLTPNEKTTLPELILVTKSGGLPLDENNGTQVLTMPAGGDCSPEFPLEINFTFNFIGKLANWRWRLFTANHEHCEWLIFEDE